MDLNQLTLQPKSKKVISGNHALNPIQISSGSSEIEEALRAAAPLTAARLDCAP